MVKTAFSAKDYLVKNRTNGFKLDNKVANCYVWNCTDMQTWMIRKK